MNTKSAPDANYKLIKTQEEANVLLAKINNFKNLTIENLYLLNDDKLYLRFKQSDEFKDKLVFLFSGGITYKLNSTEKDFPTYKGASLFLYDGFWYLIDGMNLSFADLNDKHRVIKGRKLEYKFDNINSDKLIDRERYAQLIGLKDDEGSLSTNNNLDYKKFGMDSGDEVLLSMKSVIHAVDLYRTKQINLKQLRRWGEWIITGDFYVLEEKDSSDYVTEEINAIDAFLFLNDDDPMIDDALKHIYEIAKEYISSCSE